MKFKIAATLLALSLLAACAPEIESSIYLQDVAQVVAEQTAISVPAILRVPQSSEESCTKGLSQLIENLKDLAPVSGKGKCVEKNTGSTTDQLAEIETEMVIATPDAPFDAQNLFLLEVADAGGGKHDLTFRLMRPIDEIVKKLAVNSDELTADLDPANFIFTLNNDGAGPIQLTAHHVFVDGEPALPETGDIALDRRKTASIVFSDVASTYVERANGYRFATITLP